MSDVQTACPLNVRTDQLSALYDDDLDTDAAELREHVATCAACQRRLGAYAHISAALKAQQVPTPDARLRRGILAARSRRPLSNWSGGRDLWRAALVAVALLLIVGGFAGLLLSHIRPGHIASASTPTLAPSAPTPTATASASANWLAILPHSRFSVGPSQGFAVSAARPGRLIGCGVPGDGTDAWPYPALAISDDGGQTWRQSSIQTIGSVTECIVVVDQMRPDTIIVGGNGSPSQLAVTTDAGRTWRKLALPPDMQMIFPGTLVDGQLIGQFHTFSNPFKLALGALSIDGSFRILDSRLPYQDSATDNTPMAFTVDPTNPLHLYAIIPAKWDPAHPSSDVLLYATSDGGASWRLLHTFPFGERIDLWAPTPDALYLWVSYPWKSLNGNPLQESVDGGVTWRAITPANYRLGGAWFGPDGRIVVISGTNTNTAPTLAELNPATGALTPLGQPPATSRGSAAEPFDGTVTGGASPVFVVAGFDATYVTPLP